MSRCCNELRKCRTQALTLTWLVRWLVDCWLIDCLSVEIDSEQNQTRLLNLIYVALCTFDHDYQDVHNKLVVAGGDRTLVKCLDNAVTDPTNREAIDPICKLLLMLYRCGDDQFQDSIAIVGGDLFPPLLATVFLEDGETKVCESAQALMQRLNRMKLDLRDVPWSHSLLHLFHEVIEAVDPSTHVQPLSFVMTWLVEGLLLPRENNKLFLMEHPGIFECIVTKFATSFRGACPINLNVSKFMKILARAAANRRVMVQRLDFFRLLFLLSLDESVATQQEVLETLTLTSLDQVGRTKIIEYLDHKFVDFSIEALENTALVSDSLHFIDVLAQHVSGKILLSKRPALLPRLTKQAILEEKEYSLLAAQTVVRFAKSLSVNHGKGDLLDSLLSLCKAKDHRIRYEGIHALLDQCQSRPGCSFFIVHVSEATIILAKLVIDEDTEVRRLAAELVANLAASPLNVRALAKNGPLLSALAATATRVCQPSNEKAQQNAVAAILHVVVHHRSIEAAAKDNSIVRPLSEYGLSGDKRQILKQAAVHGVACLSSYF